MPPLLTELRERLRPVWKSAVFQFKRSWPWLIARQQEAFVATGAVVVLLLFAFSGVTAAVAAVAAWIALLRHFAQTEADRQRRITETYSKAVEQLASDKMELRLGGIYTLERISHESPDDYWTVMETLCAFVRERARWQKPEEAPSETVVRLYEKEETTGSRISPPTDIAAVLAVIVRRDDKSRQREIDKGWKLDFHETDLRGANLNRASVPRADLSEANLREASLWSANLSEANLFRANLWRADLHLADLSGVVLSRAVLNEAVLIGANLSRAVLSEANLCGANLVRAKLNEGQLVGTTGDARTQLPDGFTRPTHWPAYEP
jgi:hypothetical protein